MHWRSEADAPPPGYVLMNLYAHTAYLIFLRGFVAFVSAQQAYVKIEARKIEVVRIATELCYRKFRREYQSHVGLAFVMVEVIDRSMV